MAIVAMLAVLGASSAQAESERIAVEGVVEDDVTGAPLAGITVVGEHVDFSEPSIPDDVGVATSHEFDRDQTDEHGRYRLEGATFAGSDESWVTTLDESGRSFRYLRGTFRLPTVSGVQPFTTIALTQSGTVRGHVTDDESGDPIAGVAVSAGTSGPHSVTRADGSFELVGVRPGELQFRFSRYASSESGRLYFPYETPPLFVERATATIGVDASLVPAAVLRGTLVAPEGQPPPVGNVVAVNVRDGAEYRGFFGASDGGRWGVGLLPPGTYRVQFPDPYEYVPEGAVGQAPAGYAATWLGGAYVEDDAATVDLSAAEVLDVGTTLLAYAGGMRGDLREAVTGRPIPSACITVIDAAGREVLRIAHFFSNPGPRYRLDHLPPIELRVRVDTAPPPSCVEGYGQSEHSTRWFAAAQRLEEATPVTLGPREILTDADILLERRVPPAGLDATVVDQVGRIAGADRITTAAALATGGWPEGAESVVVASSETSADALAGGPLAALERGPLLLTGAAMLHPASRDAIERLRPQRAFVLGGEATLSQQVEEDLAAAGIWDIVRIAGADRVETSALIAERVLADDHRRSPEAFLVAAEDGSPDAIAVSGVAASKRVPILLTHRDTLPEATRALLSRVSTVVVVGGVAAISDGVAQAATAMSVRVERIAGGDRFETSSEIVRLLSPDTQRLWLVTGAGWADALAAGPAVARDGGALILVPGREPPTSERLARIAPLLANLDRVLLVGGPAAIRPNWEDAVRAAAVAEQSAQ